MTQQPGSLDLRMYQGATWQYELTWLEDDVPVDLTSYTARLQVREFVNSDSTILDIDTDSEIVLGGAAGTITMTVAASVTTNIEPGFFVYDLEMITGATVTRLIQGAFIVTPEITR